MEIEIARIYDSTPDGEARRILVDRLWPRGISKQKANLDLWAKELAPSTQARRDFGHKPENFAAFKDRYLAELEQSAPAQELIASLLAEGTDLLLLYAAKDPACNHALLLRDYLRQRL